MSFHNEIVVIKVPALSNQPAKVFFLYQTNTFGSKKWKVACHATQHWHIISRLCHLFSTLHSIFTFHRRSVQHSRNAHCSKKYIYHKNINIKTVCFKIAKACRRMAWNYSRCGSVCVCVSECVATELHKEITVLPLLVYLQPVLYLQTSLRTHTYTYTKFLNPIPNYTLDNLFINEEQCFCTCLQKKKNLNWDPISLL